MVIELNATLKTAADINFNWPYKLIIITVDENGGCIRRWWQTYKVVVTLYNGGKLQGCKDFFFIKDNGYITH